MTGYHTRWIRPPEQAEDPERIAIREGVTCLPPLMGTQCRQVTPGRC